MSTSQPVKRGWEFAGSIYLLYVSNMSVLFGCIRLPTGGGKYIFVAKIEFK